MTAAEARVAVRLNSIVRNERLGVGGYVCSFQYVHYDGEDPHVSVGFMDQNRNCVYSGKPEELTVTNWLAPDFIVKDWIAKEEEKLLLK